MSSTFHDGDEARWRGNRVDVLVLDVMMPLDGFTVVRRLRDRGVTTPALFLTARGEVADRVEGLAAGGDDYLVKPFAFDELVARIRALGRRRQAPIETVLTVGAIRLDLIRHEVMQRRRHRLAPPSSACWSTSGTPADAVTAPDPLACGGLTRRPRRHWSICMRTTCDKAGRAALTTIRGIGYRLEAPARTSDRRDRHRVVAPCSAACCSSSAWRCSSR
jgi:CheY-like chemotaxis protein